LELIVSSFQFMGMVLFIAAEVMEGQLNVPALDPVGVPGNRWANVKFDLYHFTYYWFGFWFCNLIWYVMDCVRTGVWIVLFMEVDVTYRYLLYGWFTVSGCNVFCAHDIIMLVSLFLFCHT
jgi:hypothetical protein